MLITESTQMLLGSLPTWLTLLTIVILGYYFVKGAGGTALNTLQTANEVLEKRVKALEAQAVEDKKTIAELRARSDLSIQLAPIVKWTGESDAREQERFDATAKVLAGISQALTNLAHAT